MPHPVQDPGAGAVSTPQLDEQSVNVADLSLALCLGPVDEVEHEVGRLHVE